MVYNLRTDERVAQYCGDWQPSRNLTKLKHEITTTLYYVPGNLFRPRWVRGSSRFVTICINEVETPHSEFCLPLNGITVSVIKRVSYFSTRSYVCSEIVHKQGAVELLLEPQNLCFRCHLFLCFEHRRLLFFQQLDWR